MRQRLLRSTLTIALVAVVTLGVPLLVLARQQVWTSAREGLRQQAATTAAGVEDRIDAHEAVDLTRFAAASRGRRIVLVTASGTRTTAGPALAGPVLQASVTVSGSTVTVQADRHPTVVRAREVTALVVGLVVLAVAAAVALALAQARRLTRPLSDLHDRAEALGRGELAPRVLTSGIREIDGISQVLERSARQLGTTIELQRDFASDAAHQLRTPLTGIGLRLDELTRIGDEAVRQEAEDALAQVERLDRVISALLARARGDAAAPTLLDLAEVLRQETSVWSQALEAHDRVLSLDLQPGVWVRARREHLTGVVTCLLENALRHGSGTVSVSSRRVGDLVLVLVADEGTGLGLALARSLATAEGGGLRLAQAAPACFELSLPAVTPPG